MSNHLKRGTSYLEPEIGMTPMIDVVFLLLVFFVVTFKPMELLAHLPLDRPQAGDGSSEPPAFTLTILESGYLANNKRVSLDQVDRYLNRMHSKFGVDSLLIICHDQSAHSSLMQALDVCAKNGVDEISLFSR